MRVRGVVASALLLACSLQIATAASAAPASWSGFYAGINAGWATADSTWDNIATDPAGFGDTLPPATMSDRISGVLGGVQLGYNFQSGPLVFGADIVANLGAVSGEIQSPFGAADDFFDLNIAALIAATGRLGYAWERSLIYLKGGIAAALVKASATDVAGPTTGAGRDESWRIGPSVGVGFEYAMSSAVSVALEYNYVHLSDMNYELGDGTGRYVWRIDVPDIHWIAVRLNHRLN